jgi:hypothetical protein
MVVLLARLVQVRLAQEVEIVSSRFHVPWESK